MTQIYEITLAFSDKEAFIACAEKYSGGELRNGRWKGMNKHANNCCMQEGIIEIMDDEQIDAVIKLMEQEE